MKRHIVLRLVAMIMVIFLLFAFGGCAKRSESLAKDKADSFGNGAFTAEAPAPVATVGMVSSSYSTAAQDSAGRGVIAPIVPTGGFVPDALEKLIYTGNLNIQTKEFEKTLEVAKNLTKELGGFIESSSTSGDTYYADGTAKATVRNRSASITYRVPQKSFDRFFSALGNLGNVVDSSMNVQNITAQFVDNEAHLNSLKIEQDRLLELLKKADKVEDMISLEKSLADVRYQIESITSTLRTWQTQVDYSTISVNISEVSDYTKSLPAVRSFWQRLADAFVQSGRSFVHGVQSVTIGFILILPSLLFCAVILLAAVFVTKKYLFGRRNRREQVPPANSTEKE